MCAAALIASMSVAAQSPPPIHGVTGTLALEGTINKVYSGVNTIAVRTIDGVEHVFHYTKKLLSHGPKGTNESPLEGFKEGSWVVVHYTTNGDTQTADEIDSVGDEGLKTTEGVVTRVDKKRQQITVRLPDGKIETFRLTDRAAADSGNDLRIGEEDGTRVLVYYKDEKGGKVAHYFKKVA
jgi:hypothetical protein